MSAIEARAGSTQNTFGTIGWIQQRFDFGKEKNLIRRVIQENELGKGQDLAAELLIRELHSTLTENGLGREALTIQPATRYVLRANKEGVIEVFAHQLDDVGEQLKPFMSLKEFPDAVGIGLKRAFEHLYQEAHVGKGISTFSPTELYQTYDSPGDVINPMVVTNVTRNETNQIQEVEVAGWFLFLNKKLTDEQRQFILQKHASTQLQGNSANLSISETWWWKLPRPEQLVSNPQEFKLNGGIRYSNGQLSDKTIEPYVHFLQDEFKAVFGEELFKLKEDNYLKRYSRELIEANIAPLLNLLLSGDQDQFLLLLMSLADISQRTYAEVFEADAEVYMQALYAGQISIKGFHITNGENLDIYWDDFTRTWKGGDACGGGTESTTNHCHKHDEEYSEKECPKCKKEKTSKTILKIA